MTGVPDKCGRCPYTNERFGLTLAAKEDDGLRLQAEEHGSLYADPGSWGGGGGSGTAPFLVPRGERGPADTRTSDFWPPEP